MAISAHSAEEASTLRAAETTAGGGSSTAPGARRQRPDPNLDSYTVNHRRAKQGKIDSVLGRDFEIRQVIDILLRRRQNNPILVGGARENGRSRGFAIHGS